MTIWLLTFLLLACLVAAGWRQGAIRAGISFFGIILSALLAVPLGKLVAPLLKILGVSNPLLLWALPPFIAFVVVLALIKVGAFMVHQKVDVYYKYKAGDLRLSLFERLNHRLGACVGLLNGVVYLVLISWVVYALSYWTVQMASGENDPRTQRLVSQLGRDLQSTGFAKAARAVDSLSPAFYDTADLAGLLYQNPMCEARLMRYPGFLSLGEREELQALGQDAQFSAMRMRQASLREVMDYPQARTILNNPDLLRSIWSTVQPDMKDLNAFLETGKSTKYDGERILGRWNFDANGTVLLYRRARPNVAGGEVARLRAWINEKFPKSSIVAAPDHMVALKSVPHIVLQPGQPYAGEAKNFKGQWKEAGTGYEFDLEGGTVKRAAKFEGNRLVITGDATPVVFVKEE